MRVLVISGHLEIALSGYIQACAPTASLLGMGESPAFLTSREFLQLLEADAPRARSYLRHPVWRAGGIPRCECGTYALLYGIHRLIDADLVHGGRLCQPGREVIW